MARNRRGNNKNKSGYVTKTFNKETGTYTTVLPAVIEPEEADEAIILGEENVTEPSDLAYFKYLLAKGIIIKKDIDAIEEIRPIADDKYIKYTTKRELAIGRMMEIFLVQSPSYHEEAMTKFITNKLSKMLVNFEIDEEGNILVTKGEVKEGEKYPCIVAHMDTVHSKADNYSVRRGNLTNSDTEVLWAKALNKKTGQIEDYGGCGDDGAGIYVALEALRHIDNIKVAFFVAEEVGCIGSGRVDMKFFEDCAYIMQGDRKGSGDLILDYYGSSVVSPKFLADITPMAKKYGFRQDDGSFTDVMELANRDVGVSVFNFSVGYYSAHSDSEYTIIDELINSTEFALNTINILGNKEYSHTFTGYRYTGSSYYTGIHNYGSFDHIYGYGNESYGGDDFYDEDGYFRGGRNNANTKVLDAIATESDVTNDMSDCTCSNTHVFLGAFDFSCYECNPYIKPSDHFCVCGCELEERKFSYNCAECTEIFVKMEKYF